MAKEGNTAFDSKLNQTGFHEGGRLREKSLMRDSKNSDEWSASPSVITGATTPPLASALNYHHQRHF